MPEATNCDENVLGSGPSWSYRFRLVHLFYAIALLAAGLATFGMPGLEIGIIVLIGWGFVFGSLRRVMAFQILGVAIFLLCVGSCFFLPLWPTGYDWHREPQRQQQCDLAMRNLSLALQSYCDWHGEFPPAYFTDDAGQPMHSWRVLVLPFVEERALYQRYRFDEPWDGPNNRQLLAEMPGVYRCPSHSKDREPAMVTTNYFAVVDSRTAWPHAGSRSFGRQEDFPDGMSHTIMIVESGDKAVPWTSPDDVGLNEYINAVATASGDGPHQSEDFFHTWSAFQHVAMVDGSVHAVVDGCDADLLRKCLLVDDGSTVDVRDLDHRDRKLRWGNLYRLVTFMLLVIFPMPWVGAGRREIRAEPGEASSG